MGLLNNELDFFNNELHELNEFFGVNAVDGSEWKRMRGVL